MVAKTTYATPKNRAQLMANDSLRASNSKK
jgi:hypothetical protein